MKPVKRSRLPWRGFRQGFVLFCLLGFALYASPAHSQRPSNANLRRSGGSGDTPKALGSVTRQDANGIGLVVLQRPSPFINLELVVAGGLNQTRPMLAAEGLLLYCLVNTGPASLPTPVAFQAALERVGLEISIVRETDYAAIRFKCLREDFPKAWPLFLEAMLAPRFEPEAFEALRHQYASRLLAKGSQEWDRTDSIAKKTFFGIHPYARTTFGDYQLANTLPLDSITLAHRRLFANGRLRVVASGQLSVSELAEPLATYLPRLPQGQIPPAPGRVGLSATNVAYHEAPEHTGNYIEGLFPAPSAGEPDGQALQVALFLFERRLRSELCFQRSLSCEMACEHYPYQTGYGAIRFATRIPNPTIKMAIDLLKTAQTRGFTEAELTEGRKEMLNQLYQGVEGSDGLTHRLAEAEYLGQTEAFLHQPEALSRLRLEDLNRTFRLYTEHIEWTLYGDARNVGRGVFVRP